MKNKVVLIGTAFLLLCGVFAFFGWSNSQTQSQLPTTELEPEIPTNSLVYDKDAPVYVTFYSHNEDSWESLVRNKRGYEYYREGLIERSDIFAQNNIPWDWQTDQPVLEAMLEFEDHETLPYIQENGASLDPHAHTNNYADIAHLMELLGGTPSSVIGGVAHVECGREHLGFLDLVSWHDAIGLEADGLVHGRNYPNTTWQPLVLSDPGMGGHYFDDWTSGVWKPGDADEFYTHNPENNIVYIGEGYPHDNLLVGSHQASGAEVFASNGEYIKELVGKIKTGELPTGTTNGEKFMYTASIHVRDTVTVDESGDDAVNTAEGLRAIIAELLPLEEAGDIIFVNFEQAAAIWKNEYNEVPNQTGLEDFSMYQSIRKQAENHCKLI